MQPETPKDEPLTFSRFVKFYEDFIEPRFNRIEKKLEDHDQKFEQVDRRFEDLYGKFEMFTQEYVFANEQIKRISQVMVTKQDLEGLATKKDIEGMVKKSDLIFAIDQFKIYLSARASN